MWIWMHDPKQIPNNNNTIDNSTFPALSNSLDQNKLFVSESLVPLTQLAKWYKEPKKQFSDL